MNKKTGIFIAVLSLLVGVLTFVFFIQPKLINHKKEPVVKSEKTVDLISWEDPAGFQFSYPENLKIDSHEEDEENYAHLELTSLEHSGRILIWVKETTYTDLEDWLEKEVGIDTQVLDSELAGRPAKKIAYSQPQRLTTVIIDVDALILVEMEPDPEGRFQKVYDQILQSFELIPLEGEPPFAEASEGQVEFGPAGGGQIIEEPEEVIE